jgi:hypothetical protein
MVPIGAHFGVLGCPVPLLHPKTLLPVTIREARS